METRGSPLASFYELVQDELEKVEENLTAIAQADSLFASQLLSYIFKSGGKRIRPALLLLSGKLYTFDPRSHFPAATAIELLHTATLVHDDIVDRSPLRRGKPTVNSLWGDGRALLLGDYLFAKAADLVIDAGNKRVQKLFIRAILTLTGGELAQTFSTFDINYTLEQYYRWIGSKTASLFTLATQSGAILGRSPAGSVTALKNYGYNLGMAFQIVDDILDFVGDEKEMGKPIGSDLREGVLTLPALLFLECFPESDCIKKFFEFKDEECFKEAIRKVSRSPIIDKCLVMATDFCLGACKALEKLPDTPYRKALFDLAQYVVHRRW